MTHSPPAYTEGSNPSKDICKYFLRGYCRFGDSCHNEHPQNSHRQDGSGSRPGSHTSKKICQHFLNGYCRFGDDRRNEHPRNSQKQGESGSRQQQANVAETSRTPGEKSSDLVRVSCAYGDRGNKSVVFTRDMLQNCSWNEALFKFRQEFPSISSKRSDKVRFEGRFSDANGQCRWEGVSSQEFEEMIKRLDELRIKVWRSADSAWE